MISDSLKTLCKILIGGVRIEIEPAGNLGNGQVVVETKVEDTAVGLLQLLVSIS